MVSIIWSCSPRVRTFVLPLRSISTQPPFQPSSFIHSSQFKLKIKELSDARDCLDFFEQHRGHFKPIDFVDLLGKVFTLIQSYPENTNEPQNKAILTDHPHKSPIRSHKPEPIEALDHNKLSASGTHHNNHFTESQYTHIPQVGGPLHNNSIKQFNKDEILAKHRFSHKFGPNRQSQPMVEELYPSQAHNIGPDFQQRLFFPTETIGRTEPREGHINQQQLGVNKHIYKESYPTKKEPQVQVLQQYKEEEHEEGAYNDRDAIFDRVTTRGFTRKQDEIAYPYKTSKQIQSHPILLDPIFSRMLTDIIHLVDRFTIDELLQVCFTVWLLKPREKLLLKASLHPFTQHLTQLKPYEIARATLLYSHTYLANPPFCQALQSIIEHKAADFDIQSLSSICEASSKLPHKPVQLLQGLLPHILGKHTEINPRPLSLIIYAFTKQKNSCDPEDLHSLLDSFLAQDLTLVDTSSLLRVIWAAATLSRDLSHDQLSQIEEILTDRMGLLNERSVATLIWAFSSLQIGSYTFFQLLRDSFTRKYPRMNSIALVNSIYGLSLKFSRILGQNGAFEIDFLINLEDFLIKQISAFTERDLSRLALAYAMARCGGPNFWAAIQNSCLQNHRHFTHNEVADLLYSFGSIRGGHKLFSKFHMEVLEMLHLFPTHSLCDICWGYAINRFSDEQFWQTLISAIPVEKVKNDHRCALLYPTLEEVQHLSPQLSIPKIASLSIYTQDAYWNYQLCDFPYKFSEEIKHLILKYTPHTKVETCYDFEGYLIDIWLTRSHGGPIAVFCHTHLTSHIGLDKLLGGPMLKHRYLIRKGILVFDISWTLWKEWDDEEKWNVFKDFLT